MSMVGIVEPRYGASVYVGEKFDICIKQAVETGEDAVVILSRDEVRQLIRLLQAAVEKSEELEHQKSDSD